MPPNYGDVKRGAFSSPGRALAGQREGPAKEDNGNLSRGEPRRGGSGRDP